MKIAIPFGPAHGEPGMAKNEGAGRTLVEVLGDEAFIALDIYMSRDYPTQSACTKRSTSTGIAWLEEPVMPGLLRWRPNDSKAR